MCADVEVVTALGVAGASISGRSRQHDDLARAASGKQFTQTRVKTTLVKVLVLQGLSSSSVVCNASALCRCRHLDLGVVPTISI